MHTAERLLSSSAESEDSTRETALLLSVLIAANRSTNVDEIAETSLRAILSVVPADLAFFLLIDPRSARLRLSHPVNTPESLVRSLEHIEVPDQFFSQVEDPDRAAFALSHLTDEIRSLLAVHEYRDPVTMPLLAENRGLGVLTLARREGEGDDLNLLHPAHRDLLEAIGTAVGSAWQRARLAEQLRASEEKYRSFIEQSPDGFWESDLDGFITLVNQAALEMVGYSREEVLGKLFPSLAIDDEQTSRRRVARLERDGYFMDERYRFRAKDGSLKTANLSVRAVRDENGKIVKYQTVARDATASVLVEQELKRRVSELEAIARVGELIAQSADPEQPLRETAREICDILHADSVSFQLSEGDSMCIVWSSVEQSTTSPILDYQRQILEGFEPRVVPDRDATGVDEGQRAVLIRLGFASSVGVRLFAQGVALGILFVNQRTPREWTPAEVQLISTFARQVAGAMHNTNLLRETQARVRELESVAEMSMITASLIGEERLIDRALQFISDSLSVDMAGVHLLEGKQFRLGRRWGADQVLTEPLDMTPMLQEIVEARRLFVFDRDHPLPPDPQAERRVSEVSARAVLAAPLVSGSGVIGVLTVGRRAEHLWTHAEERSVQTIANQLATGISNARLFSSLQQEREEMEATLNSVFSGVFTTDESGIIQSWNRAAAEMSGYSAEVMRGENWAEAAHIGNKPDNLIFEAMAGGEVVFGLALRTLTTADGRMIPLGEAAAPLRDQAGKIRGSVGAFWDRTREHAAERAKLDFLHEVSHELRNSLTAVLAMASMLGDKTVHGATRERAIQVLSEQGDRLKAFSERFLQFEREQFKQPLQEESLDVGKELGRLVEAARLEHPHHSFTLVGEAGAAYADRARLDTIVTNLLDNAAKYSPPGSPISIEAKPMAGGRVGISIRNEGPAIPAEELERIFERGYHAPVGGADWEADGTGVGLWLVDTKLHEMGGEIRVDSDGILGVTFTFTLRQARGKDGQEQFANSDRGRRQSRG